MSEAQYYTPTIDEFHVGFRVQVLNSEGMYQWGDYTIEEDWATPPWIYNIDSERVRVKLLDAEDIIAEGWKAANTVFTDTQYSIPTFVKHFEKWNIFMALRDSGMCEIWSVSGARIQGVYFHGTIRNRSELRRIMKMTGIV